MTSLYSRIWTQLLRDRLLMALIALFPLVFLLAPVPVSALPHLVDWKTVAALAGLMVLSRGLELCGLIDRAGRWLLTRLHSLRGLAVAMVVFAALLSAVVTNDVALFVTVPLTLTLARMAALPVGRLVVFQALAVNAGSAGSPVGNPQNLFLWQQSGAGFLEFTLALLPMAGAMMALVLALVPMAFDRESLAMAPNPQRVPLQVGLMTLSLAAYPLFLWAVNAGLAEPAAALVILLFALSFRQVLRGISWALLLIFVLMFVNLGLLGRIPAVAALVAGAMQGPSEAFALGAILSQLMSNVPAAILLAGFTEEWRALAWGVNAGGFGLAIGSLANLIALRLAPAPSLWWDFHRWSLPMLLASALAGALLLAIMPG